MARFLHGFHDMGGESLHGDRPGWTLISEEVGLNESAQGKDYREVSNLGIAVIVRLNYSHMGQGTFPLPQDYGRFAKACTSFVRSSVGVSHWIIGNEPNHEGERPQGQVIQPEDAARCFVEVRNLIKNHVGTHIQVGPPAIAPYHASPTPWDEYLTRMLESILNAQTTDLLGMDFLNIHAYARSMAPGMLMTEKEMDAPLEGLSYGFGALWDAFVATPQALWSLPAILSEFDITKEWENKNTGIIQEMYRNLDVSNTDGYWPKIIAGICFRWLMGQNKPIDWGMSAKPHLLEDFKGAVMAGYMAPTVSGTSEKNQTFLPSTPNQGATPPPKPPTEPVTEAEIDQRYLDRGAKLHPGSGDKVWRLKRAEKVGSAQSGGRHHIYVEAYDEAGNPVSVPFSVAWPGTILNDRATNGKKGFDAGNFNMSPGAFDVWINDGQHDSDVITGIEMGEMTSGGWNAGHHTSAILEFRLEETIAEPETTPGTPTQPPSFVPYLAHPIAEPAYRTVSQVFGARPEYYSQFKVDGVPLKGHEGIDFAAPIGSKVQAVADGYVAEVGNQGDTGYGKYIKLIHSWGETVYAHLDSQWVAQGETVKKGQGLGQVGYTGNVQPKGPRGAHLHFGLRTNPFNRQDGWGGYKNPEPFLAGSNGSKPGPSPDKETILQIVKDAAKEFGVPENLLISLIHGESSFNPRAENKDSGAKGLGQLRDGAWRDATAVTGGTDVFNARDNARATAYYLKWCMNLVGGDERRGLWAYNWSPRDTPKGLIPPEETLYFASKILHGKEVLDLAGE